MLLTLCMRSTMNMQKKSLPLATVEVQFKAVIYIIYSDCRHRISIYNFIYHDKNPCLCLIKVLMERRTIACLTATNNKHDFGFVRDKIIYLMIINFFYNNTYKQEYR